MKFKFFPPCIAFILLCKIVKTVNSTDQNDHVNVSNNSVNETNKQFNKLNDKKFKTPPVKFKQNDYLLTPTEKPILIKPLNKDTNKTPKLKIIRNPKLVMRPQPLIQIVPVYKNTSENITTLKIKLIENPLAATKSEFIEESATSDTPNFFEKHKTNNHGNDHKDATNVAFYDVPAKKNKEEHEDILKNLENKKEDKVTPKESTDHVQQEDFYEDFTTAPPNKNTQINQNFAFESVFNNDVNKLMDNKSKVIETVPATNKTVSSNCTNMAVNESKLYDILKSNNKDGVLCQIRILLDTNETKPDQQLEFNLGKEDNQRSSESGLYASATVAPDYNQTISNEPQSNTIPENDYSIKIITRNENSEEISDDENEQEGSRKLQDAEDDVVIKREDIKEEIRRFHYSDPSNNKMYTSINDPYISSPKNTEYSSYWNIPMKQNNFLNRYNDYEDQKQYIPAYSQYNQYDTRQEGYIPQQSYTNVQRTIPQYTYRTHRNTPSALGPFTEYWSNINPKRELDSKYPFPSVDYNQYYYTPNYTYNPPPFKYPHDWSLYSGGVGKNYKDYNSIEEQYKIKQYQTQLAYNPFRNYRYNQIENPSQYENVLKTWRKTEFHIKEKPRNRVKQIELNCNNVNARKFKNNPLSIFNQGKRVINGNGC